MPVNPVFRSANLIIAPLTFLYLPAITVFSPNRNITNLEPERNQRACHSQDSNAFVVDRRLTPPLDVFDLSLPTFL